MKTETYTITVLTYNELKDILRAPMEACGFKVERLCFTSENWEIIRVASGFDLSTPSAGTLEDLIREDEPHGDREVPTHLLAMYLAVLTDEAIYGEKALPKTDYRITDSI